MTSLSYRERAKFCVSGAGKKLLLLLEEKETNLALSADVTTSEQLLYFADLLGPQICLLKTHIDIIEDFTPSLVKELKTLSRRHDFLIFEDRKFADIGNTVKQQYGGGIYHIAEWADFVNAHILPGPGIIEGLAQVGIPLNRGLILLAEMSSKGHLMDADYIKKTEELAKRFPEFVIGFITQKNVSDSPNLINLTPGVQIAAKQDNLGQQYITPQIAINQNRSDIIIVGRGIIQASNPLEAAKQYRETAWRAYLNRINIE